MDNPTGTGPVRTDIIGELPPALVGLAYERAIRRLDEQSTLGTPVYDPGDFIAREVQQATIDYASGNFP